MFNAVVEIFPYLKYFTALNTVWKLYRAKLSLFILQNNPHKGMIGVMSGIHTHNHTHKVTGVHTHKVTGVHTHKVTSIHTHTHKVNHCNTVFYQGVGSSLKFRNRYLYHRKFF